MTPAVRGRGHPPTRPPPPKAYVNPLERAIRDITVDIEMVVHYAELHAEGKLQTVPAPPRTSGQHRG